MVYKVWIDKQLLFFTKLGYKEVNVIPSKQLSVQSQQ